MPSLKPRELLLIINKILLISLKIQISLQISQEKSTPIKSRFKPNSKLSPVLPTTVGINCPTIIQSLTPEANKEKMN